MPAAAKTIYKRTPDASHHALEDRLVAVGAAALPRGRVLQIGQIDVSGPNIEILQQGVLAVVLVRPSHLAGFIIQIAEDDCISRTDLGTGWHDVAVFHDLIN